MSASLLGAERAVPWSEASGAPMASVPAAAIAALNRLVPGLVWIGGAVCSRMEPPRWCADASPMIMPLDEFDEVCCR